MLMSPKFLSPLQPLLWNLCLYIHLPIWSLLHECLRGKFSLTVSKSELMISFSQTFFPPIKTSARCSFLVNIYSCSSDLNFYIFFNSSLSLTVHIQSTSKSLNSNFKTLTIHPILMAPTATTLTKPPGLDSCNNLIHLPPSPFSKSDTRAKVITLKSKILSIFCLSFSRVFTATKWKVLTRPFKVLLFF